MTGETAAPALFGLREAAAFCSMTEREWELHHAAARVPAPIRIGRRLHWARATLEEWVRRGCPPRRVFEESRTEKA